jgi:hypothetical protein
MKYQITTSEVRKNDDGYYFVIHYNHRPYANIISLAYKSKNECYRKMAEFKQTGKLEFYNND